MGDDDTVPGERRWLWVRQRGTGGWKALWHVVEAGPDGGPVPRSAAACAWASDRAPWDQGDALEVRPRTFPNGSPNGPPTLRMVCPHCFGYWSGYLDAVMDITTARPQRVRFG